MTKPSYFYSKRSLKKKTGAAVHQHFAAIHYWGLCSLEKITITENQFIPGSSQTAGYYRKKPKKEASARFHPAVSFGCPPRFLVRKKTAFKDRYK